MAAQRVYQQHQPYSLDEGKGGDDCAMFCAVLISSLAVHRILSLSRLDRSVHGLSSRSATV